MTKEEMFNDYSKLMVSNPIKENDINSLIKFIEKLMVLFESFYQSGFDDGFEYAKELEKQIKSN